VSRPRTPHALLVTAHFPPDRGPATHRVLRFASHLHAADWDVTVLTISPEAYRPGTPTDAALLDRVPERVEIVRTWVRRPLERLSDWRRRFKRPAASSGTAGRPTGSPPDNAAPATGSGVRGLVTDLLSLPDRDIGWYRLGVAAGRRVMASKPADVIVSTAPPFTAHLIAGRLHRQTGVPWIADFRDPWSRAPWALEQRTTSWQGWVHRRLEQRVVRGATRVLLNTRRMREDFVAHYADVAPAHFVSLPNGFDPHVLASAAADSPAPDGPAVLTHAGTLYGARNPAVLFQALARLVSTGRLRPGQLHVQLLGAVSGGFGARRMVDDMALGPYVSFHKPVAHADALRMLASSHALLLFQQGTDLQVPAKLYEYVGLRRPIIAIAPQPSAVGDVVTETGLGVLVGPEDASGLADVLAAVIRKEPLARPDEAAIEGYHGERLGGEFVRVVEALRRER